MISPSSFRGLKKALYNMINNFRSKLWRSFLYYSVPLLILEIALSTCCLKLSFQQLLFQGVFDKMLFKLKYLMTLMVGWLWNCFFLENIIFWDGLLESLVKKHFPIISPSGDFFFLCRYIIAHTFKNIKALSPGTNILGVPGKEIPN